MTHAWLGLRLGLCLAAFAVLPATSLAHGETAPVRPAFCPAGYELFGSLCISGATGGETYRRIREAFDERTLCTAWDIHVMTQIEDFAQEDAFPTQALVQARMQREEAQRHMRASRFADALAIYERIFTDIEP